MCTSLFYLNPIFTILLSGIVLGERISGKEILGVLSNIIGVVLVTNPSLSQPLETPRSYVLGVCAILASSMIVSIELVILRGIGKRVHFIAHTLPFGVSAMVMGMILWGLNESKTYCWHCSCNYWMCSWIYWSVFPKSRIPELPRFNRVYAKNG